MRISDLSSDVCSSDLFDRAISNTLGIEGGRLTGTVARPVVDSAVKKATLLAEAEAARIPLDATLAVGDGANDVPMIEAAGLGAAYHAKPKTAAAAHARIEHNDLSALLDRKSTRLNYSH